MHAIIWINNFADIPRQPVTDNIRNQDNNVFSRIILKIISPWKRLSGAVQGHKIYKCGQPGII